jgi:hypothetical protein
MLQSQHNDSEIRIAYIPNTNQAYYRCDNLDVQCLVQQ